MTERGIKRKTGKQQRVERGGRIERRQMSEENGCVKQKQRFIELGRRGRGERNDTKYRYGQGKRQKNREEKRFRHKRREVRRSRGKSARAIAPVTYLILISPGEETCKWRGRVAPICMWIITFLSPASPSCLIGADGQVNVCDWLEWLRCASGIRCFGSGVGL